MAKAGQEKATGGLEGIAAMLPRGDGKGSGKGLPPVHLWNPPFCGDIDMKIDTDGTWFYQKTPIGRPALVKLFASVLKREGDKYFLVTPVEKVGIAVADAPFLAVEMNVSGQGDGRMLTFRTNVGDVVEAGPEHPLRFLIAGGNSELKPYVLVRGRLEALVSRAVMYDLVALGETVEIDGVAMFAVRSGGVVFPIMPAADLDALSQ